MKTVIFLAQCMDKSHLEDAVTIKYMKRIHGIDDAFETHVPYENEEYCLAGVSNSEQLQHKKIISELLKDKNIKSVKKVSLDSSPF